MEVGVIPTLGFSSWSKSCYSGEGQVEVLEIDTQPASDKINQKQCIIFWVCMAEISATLKDHKNAWVEVCDG